jgi:Domain of unknown function (DU1801)
MPKPAFTDPDVAAVFAAYPQAIRARLLQLRRLIFDVAKATPGVGEIHEALRWGEPSYLTFETGSGSMVRLGVPKDDPSQLALYFHCQSGLVESFRELYGGTLKFEGKRSILLASGDNPEADALRHCVALALTHHLRKRRKKPAAG